MDAVRQGWAEHFIKNLITKLKYEARSRRVLICEQQVLFFSHRSSHPLCFIDLVRGMLSGPLMDSHLAPPASADSSFLSTFVLFRSAHTVCVLSHFDPLLSLHDGLVSFESQLFVNI